ncbi:MAG: TRAP transporter large permease, partial [Oscillospiraceae bacterium]|nr:TRAP transporter large permease [Oscillospiraceae bacterium]
AVLGCLSLGYPLVVIGQKMVSGVDSFLLIAVPLFILAGNLMNAGKITEKLFDTAKELVGWIPGGLAHANVVASIIFAGMSGSAVADAGGLGAIEMEAMKTNGYDEEFSGAVTASSSVIGPVFPPSIPLIIYGSVASVSVDKLFMGGVVPGVLMGILLMIMILGFAIVRKYECHPFNFMKLIRQFLYSIPALMTPIIILCGFVVGWFTPTEASSIAVIYSLLIALFLYRTLDWKSFLKCLKDSAISSANTLFIIGTSTLFTYVMAMEGISGQMANAILGLSSNPNVILLVINVLLLVLGMVMEPGAILTLMLPVLLPIAKGLNLDLVQFGVMIVLNLMIGQVTPPFGVCLFVISDVNKMKLEKLYKAVLPFLIPLILTLLLVTYIPGIVTFLPNLLLTTP